MILRDDQWQRVEPLLINTAGISATHGYDNRLFIEAILWYFAKPRYWSHLPLEYGRWNNIYMRFRRWDQSGNWHQLAEALRCDPELSPLFEKIVAHADLLRQQVAQAATRRIMRQAYNSLVMKKHGAPIEGVEASSDWVRLVIDPGNGDAE